MVKRFRLNCACIFVLSILLQSFVPYCHPAIVKDTPSSAEASGYVVEDQSNKLDPAIEQIFGGSSERKDDLANFKCNVETETDKTSVQSVDTSKRTRVKRDSTIKRSNSRNLNEATRNDEKRSISSKSNKGALRGSRSSRDLPKLPNKDYEVPLDQDKSEYADETEDDFASGPRSKETARYKGGEYSQFGEDSERFIDQEERSSLYDDFETKDVVKRGISGAEDYEEMDEEAAGAGEDNAALQESSFDEEVDKRKVHRDVRVKREHENSKEANNAETSGKIENPGMSAELSNDPKTAEASLVPDTASDKDNKVVENVENKAEKDVNDQGEHSKRNIPEKSENDVSKLNPNKETDDSKQSLSTNDQMEMEGGETEKFKNQEGQEAAGDGKTQEINLSSNNKAANDLISDSSGVKGTSKVEETKIADFVSPEVGKMEVAANSAERAVAENAGKLENSKSEATMGDRMDADYEKRVEEQIQRKIDSIKEEIKREIAENQRIREIEENNAKFDELREQEEDDEEQALEAEPSDKINDISKRSVRNSGKSRVRGATEKRSMRRKKRQGENGQEKVQAASESNSNKKSRQIMTKKRSVTKSELQTPNEITAKRDYPRELFLVRADRNAKRKRRRRSKNSLLIPEQRTVKLENNLPADFAFDSNLRGNRGDEKSEDEKAIAEQDSMVGKKSGSVASLTGSNEELGPLATEYGEAFGGLNGEPGMALARFKRIKRVLRPPSSKI